MKEGRTRPHETIGIFGHFGALLGIYTRFRPDYMNLHRYHQPYIYAGPLLYIKALYARKEKKRQHGHHLVDVPVLRELQPTSTERENDVSCPSKETKHSLENGNEKQSIAKLKSYDCDVCAK